jgi:hypothetical protein
MRLRSLHALVLVLVGCGSARPGAPPTTRAPSAAAPPAATRTACAAPLAIVPATTRAAALDIELRCADRTCALQAPGHPAVATLGHGEGSILSVTRLDVDGDGEAEWLITYGLSTSLGPRGEMSIDNSELVVLDAALGARWQLAWDNAAPEPESWGCTHTARAEDRDCDGRREVITVDETCRRPMCDDQDTLAIDTYAREECASNTQAPTRVEYRRQADGRYAPPTTAR